MASWPRAGRLQRSRWYLGPNCHLPTFQNQRPGARVWALEDATATGPDRLTAGWGHGRPATRPDWREAPHAVVGCWTINSHALRYLPVSPLPFHRHFQITQRRNHLALLSAFIPIFQLRRASRPSRRQTAATMSRGRRGQMTRRDKVVEIFAKIFRLAQVRPDPGSIRAILEHAC